MWCPKCKMEYREGITVCADCGTDLVEGTAEDFCTNDICKFKEEEVADRFLEYLEYSGVKATKQKEKEEDGVFVITVPEKQTKKAEKLFHGFLLALEEEAEAKKEKELQEAAEESAEEPQDEDAEMEEEAETEEEYNWDEEEEEAEGEKEEEDAFDTENELHKKAEGLLMSGEAQENPEEILYTASEEFVTKADEYKDLKFTGITFLIFAVLGWVFMALCQFEILPLRYNKFALVVIILVFAVFFTIGIVSFFKAGRIKDMIPAEEEKTAEILKWLTEELNQEIIEDWKDPNATDEENDLLVTSHIRASLMRKYPKENIAYLEYLTERYFEENLLSGE